MQSQSLRRKVRQSSSLKGVGWADLLKMFDGDGDGQVTLEEFSEVLPPFATHFLHRVYDVLVSQTPPRLLVPFVPCRCPTATPLCVLSHVSDMVRPSVRAFFMDVETYSVNWTSYERQGSCVRAGTAGGLCAQG